MGRATVRFLRTQDDYSQREVARVTLDDSLQIDGVESLADTLLEDVDRSDQDAVLEVMRLAPERFDGAYLRASFEEEGGEAERPFDVAEGGPGSGHHGHRGIPGYQGGSMAQGGISFIGVPTSQSEHIEAYCDKQSEAWAEVMTNEEIDAAGIYSTSSYWNMNDCARKNRGCDSEVMIDYFGANVPENRVEVRAANNHLEAALNRAMVPEDTVVYRGISYSRLNKMQAGDVYQDNGFMSTTLNPTKANQWQDIPVQINVPAGTKGGYMQKFSNHRTETELLLQRGTQIKFRGFEDKVIRTDEGRVTRSIAVFDIVGQGVTEAMAFQGQGLTLREKDKERPREKRFAWSDDDLVNITDADVVPVPEPEEDQEPKEEDQEAA